MVAAALWWLPGSATLPPNNNAKLTNFARPIPLNCNFCPNCLLFLCSNGLNRGQSFENDMEVEERGGFGSGFLENVFTNACTYSCCFHIYSHCRRFSQLEFNVKGFTAGLWIRIRILFSSWIRIRIQHAGKFRGKN